MKFEPDPALTAELIKEGLTQGKLSYATVTSDSMSPLLLRGDEVQIAPVNAAKLKPGNVILLAKPDGLLVHRYWQTRHLPEGTFFITRGDRLPEFDPPTPEDCLVGEIIVRRRGSRQLSLTYGPGCWLNRRLTVISRWDARLRSIDVGDLKFENKSPNPEGHHYGQQSLGARFSGRLLYILAITLTKLVNTATKS
jgi:hypothetical protein